MQSCTKKQPTDSVTKFKKPFILYATQPDHLKKRTVKPTHIMPSQPLFAGKYRFSDTIELVLDKLNPDFQKDLLIEPGSRLPDSLDYNGLELMVDYEDEVYYQKFKHDSTLFCHYPVYLVNTTNSSKIFFGKDSHGYGIQEAVDTTRHNWAPLEYKLSDFCGNGDWGLIVRPNEFIVLLLNKYSGTIKTDMRVRIANGPTIYVSKPFQGSINPGQFSLHERTKQWLKDPEGMNPSTVFYGATIPNGWLK